MSDCLLSGLALQLSTAWLLLDSYEHIPPTSTPSPIALLYSHFLFFYLPEEHIEVRSGLNRGGKTRTHTSPNHDEATGGVVYGNLSEGWGERGDVIDARRRNPEMGNNRVGCGMHDDTGQWCMAPDMAFR